MPVANPPIVSLAQNPAAVGTSGGTVGFYSVTPVARPAAYTLTYATTDRTHPAATASAVATTAATAVTPNGYTTAAQADAIPVAINAVAADLLAVKKLLNSAIGDLKLFGLLQ